MIEQYLERLFTWESLVNTERGVEFELKNRLDDARLTGVTLARIDGEDVPLSDVTLELADGTTLDATDVTEDDPIHFDLAETVQVVIDRERLPLGTHELGVGLTIDGFGDVSFTTDDDVREEDLVDVDPADYTVAELRELVAGIAARTSLERLLDREREGKARKTAVAAIEDRLDEVGDREPVAESDRGDRTGIDSQLEELLNLVVETPQQVTVYVAGRVIGGGTAAEIADGTLLPEAKVRTVLGELEMQDLAERDGDRYEMVHPLTALRTQPRNLWQMLGP